MGMFGFIIGFELFPGIMALMVIGLIIAAIVDGPYWQHMIPLWAPGLIGLIIPIVPLFTVKWFWRETETKEISLMWIYGAFFLGPAYLYLGYWMLSHRWLLFLVYLPLSIYVLFWAVFGPIFAVADQLDDRNKNTKAYKLLGYKRSEWYNLPKNTRDDYLGAFYRMDEFWYQDYYHADPSVVESIKYNVEHGISDTSDLDWLLSE